MYSTCSGELAPCRGTDEDSGYVGATYIRVPADLFKNSLIEMARVAHEATRNVETMFQSVQYRIKHRELGAFAKLDTRYLGGQVQILDPAMMSGGGAV